MNSSNLYKYGNLDSSLKTIFFYPGATFVIHFYLVFLYDGSSGILHEEIFPMKLGGVKEVGW